MVGSRQVVVLAIVAVIALQLFSPINAAVTDNTGEIEVDNEDWSATLGEAHDLDNPNIVEDSETVEWYNETSGEWETLTQGDDYEIDYEPGEVTILETNNAGVADGDDVRASYTYEASSDTVATVVGLVPLFVVLLILVVLAEPLMEWG